MTETRELTIKAEAGNLSRIIDFVTRAAEAAGLNEDEAFHCQLAVDEAATNIIEHAYKDRQPGEIDLCCVIRSASLTIRLSDTGVPFDPAEIPEPVITADPVLMEPGGLGVAIIRRMMDEIHYSREGDMNTLTLIKRRVGLPPDRVEQGVLEREVRPGIVVITPVGRMSSDTAPELTDRLDEAIQNNRGAILIDLSRMTYISSRGLKTLLNAWREVEKQGRHMILSAPPLRIRSILETIGFDQVFTFTGSLEEALDLVEAGSDPVGGG